MAGIVQASVPTPIEVSFGDTGLFVQATIFNMTSGSPVFVGTVVMNETPGTPGSYAANFTFTPATPYMVTKRVYTDGTFTTLDLSYSPGSDSFEAVSSLGGGGSSSTCGFVVMLASSALNVILSESDLITELLDSELNLGLSEDSLTVVFPCDA